MAECLFVDPVADIAVFCSPDNQALSDEADAYEQLLATMQPFAIADAPAMGSQLLRLGSGKFGGEIENPTPGEGPARVLSLDGVWIEGKIERRTNWLTFEPEGAFAPGMSGSPIVSLAGEAIGVVSMNNGGPVLVDNLPELIRIFG